MPPKAKPNKESKKTEQKKQAKVIEDKTFGLKNKKGTKQQKFVTQVEKQVKCGGQPARKIQELEAAKKKDTKKKELEDLNSIFKPVGQKVDKGVDPKSVVCAFYKQNMCGKGDKCKFSHDLSLERKAEKRSAYMDVRDEKEETMDDWDEAKLEEVIEKKHGEKEKTKPKTDITCKFFVQALEECKYGWFWECPNGDACHYRHALPPGFVLKKDKKKMNEQTEDEISLEELIESERSKLGPEQTKTTLETFLVWKKRKRQEKIEKSAKDTAKRKMEFEAGRLVGLSGRDMFTFKPEMAGEDDDEAEDIEYEVDEEVEEEGVVEIDVDELVKAAHEVDGTGTVSTDIHRTGNTHTTINDECGKLDLAVGGGDAAGNGVEINEDLFTDDVDVDEALFDSELTGEDGLEEGISQKLTINGVEL